MFVLGPSATVEDDGVLLSLALNEAENGLFFDATTLNQRACATALIISLRLLSRLVLVGVILLSVIGIGVFHVAVLSAFKWIVGDMYTIRPVPAISNDRSEKNSTGNDPAASETCSC